VVCCRASYHRDQAARPCDAAKLARGRTPTDFRGAGESGLVAFEACVRRGLAEQRLDDLDRKIEQLKTSLAATWSGLAKSLGSADDKCQMRAQARRCSEELRRCLLIAEAKQTREHVKALSDQERALPKPNFRLLSTDAATEAAGPR